MIKLQPLAGFQLIISEKLDGSFASEKQVKKFLHSQDIKLPICYFHHQHQAHRFLCTTQSQPAKSKSIWADSVLTDQKICLAMVLADCFPILIIDQKSDAFAFIHGGWKPLVQNILELSILDLKLHFSSQAENLYAWIGPGIHSCCYQFLKKPFQAQLPDWEASVNQIKNKDSKYNWQIDLPSFIKQELNRLGVPRRQILENKQCTGCSQNLFSHHTSQNTSHTSQNTSQKNKKSGRFIAAVYPVKS